MSAPNVADATAAMAALRGCQAQLQAAYLDVQTAAPHLAGARRTRAGELADRIAGCIAFAERLVFVVAADRQSDLHEARLEAQG
ncbi:MAG TPA: hypothetical protein VGM32_09970 [Rhodopila sp.]